MLNISPNTLGLRKSFGFGDRLGLAGPGHIAALSKSKFAGVFAQQSIREMTRTQRTPEEVMQAAQNAVELTRYGRPWGADADQLKTEDDVKQTAEAGYCFFTINPGEFIVNEADTMDEAALAEDLASLVRAGVFDGPEWEEFYLGKDFEFEDFKLTFDREGLYRAAVKYARAAAHCEDMVLAIARHSPDKLYEIEVAINEADAPTSHLDHLFFALELRRRGVVVVSLAPRFVGEFKNGVDYKGDLDIFETSLQRHVAIARRIGPYKIGFHGGSDKFSIYPIIGRACGDLLHIKTSGTSYLEALRVICRTNPTLFRDIIDYASERFSKDEVGYHISVKEKDIKALSATAGDDLECVFLDASHGRQLLHVTYGSVLTLGKAASGCSLKEAILDNLQTNSGLYEEFLIKHFGKHFRYLEEG